MATLLKDYLKKYQSTGDEDKQQKKSKKKRKVVAKVPRGLTIVDNDAAWQKNIDKDWHEPDVEGDGPQMIEDVEVKHMHQIERVKQHQPYMSIGDDGSGWNSVDRKSKDAQQTSDTLRAGPLGASPLRRDPSSSLQDISPPRRNARDNYRRKNSSDIFPLGRENTLVVSPPKRQTVLDISPPKKMNASDVFTRRRNAFDIFPPRRRNAPKAFPFERIPPEDISPSRKRKLQIDSLDMSPLRRKSSRADPIDTSCPRKMTDGRRVGLIMNKEELVAEPLKKQQKKLRDMEGGGQVAKTVYRDKYGKRLESLEELLRQQQGEVKHEAKPLEWRKGLAQKREVEEQHAKFEAKKAKPFARTRDDPELDKMYKERIRWGDPMAHFVKRKDSVAESADLGALEEMKEYRFIIPQGISQQNWLKQGVRALMNRYGIKPGRHWDGKDRSTRFESQMFNAKAEKQATEMEAYLCSVSNM